MRFVCDETSVERLTVISDLGSLRFRPPVFIDAGSTFRVVGNTLVVAAHGAVLSFEGERDDRIPGSRYPEPGLRGQYA